MIDDPVVAELVDAQVVRPLRQDVLRPGQGPEQSRFPGDDDPRSAHVAVRLTASRPEGQSTDVVAVGTVLPDPPPWDPHRVDGWRIRGMATHPDTRGRGFGSRVLDTLLSHVAARGGGLVWCNARVRAQRLYGRAGFVPRGQVFDMPDLGPHIQMWRTITTDDGDSGDPPTQ